MSSLDDRKKGRPLRPKVIPLPDKPLVAKIEAQAVGTVLLGWIAWWLWGYGDSGVGMAYFASSVFGVASATLALGAAVGWKEVSEQRRKFRDFCENGDHGHSAAWLTRDELAEMGALGPKGKRLVGLLEGNSEHAGEAISEPRSDDFSHSVCLAAAGGGKTSCMALPTLMGLAHRMTRGETLTVAAIDPKKGEITAMMTPVLDALRLPYVIVDDTDVLKHPATVDMNPLDGLVRTLETNPRQYAAAVSVVANTLVPLMEDDKKHEWFRTSPQDRLAIAFHAAAMINPNAIYPGYIWTLMNMPADWENTLEFVLANGDEAAAGIAARVDEFKQSKMEYEPSHVQQAFRSLSPFQAGTELHEVGSGTTGKLFFRHHEAFERSMFVFIVGRQESRKEQVGAYFALHLQSFFQAAMTSDRHEMHIVADEAANNIVPELTRSMQLLRGQGCCIHILANGVTALELGYGEKETKAIMEGAVTKVYLKFTDYDEAKKVSDAIGEEIVIEPSVSVGHDGKPGFSYSVRRHKLITPEELLTLGGDQIVHFGGIGWLRCKKLHSSMVAPYNAMVAGSPVENKAPVISTRVTLK